VKVVLKVGDLPAKAAPDSVGQVKAVLKVGDLPAKAAPDSVGQVKADLADVAAIKAQVSVQNECLPMRWSLTLIAMASWTKTN